MTEQADIQRTRQEALDRLVDLAYTGAQEIAPVDAHTTAVTFAATQIAQALGLRFDPPEWAVAAAVDRAAWDAEERAAAQLQMAEKHGDQPVIYVAVGEQVHQPGLGVVGVLGADRDGRVLAEDTARRSTGCPTATGSLGCPAGFGKAASESPHGGPPEGVA